MIFGYKLLDAPGFAPMGMYPIKFVGETVAALIHDRYQEMQ